MAFLYTPEQYNAPDANEKLIVSGKSPDTHGNLQNCNPAFIASDCLKAPFVLHSKDPRRTESAFNYRLRDYKDSHVTCCPFAVEDTWNFWPLIKDAFESRAPFKRATLNNKTKNPVALEKLPVEFITSTDSRLRSRPEGQRTPFWFRHPYCHLIVVTCEVSLKI